MAQPWAGDAGATRTDRSGSMTAIPDACRAASKLGNAAWPPPRTRSASSLAAASAVAAGAGKGAGNTGRTTFQSGGELPQNGEFRWDDPPLLQETRTNGQQTIASPRTANAVAIKVARIATSKFGPVGKQSSRRATRERVEFTRGTRRGWSCNTRLARVAQRGATVGAGRGSRGAQSLPDVAQRFARTPCFRHARRSRRQARERIGQRARQESVTRQGSAPPSAALAVASPVGSADTLPANSPLR